MKLVSTYKLLCIVAIISKWQTNLIYLLSRYHYFLLWFYSISVSAISLNSSFKVMYEFRSFVRASLCSKHDSVVGVEDDVVSGRSEGVQEDVPFRDILVFVCGLPVQLYRDVTASDRDNAGSKGVRIHGHQEKKCANPRRNLTNKIFLFYYWLNIYLMYHSN